MADRTPNKNQRPTRESSAKDDNASPKQKVVRHTRCDGVALECTEETMNALRQEGFTQSDFDSIVNAVVKVSPPKGSSKTVDFR